MQRTISFKTWTAVFFGGIWQFVRTIFSWKNKPPFWRAVWATITVCIVILTSIAGYAFYDETYVRNRRYAWHDGRRILSGSYCYVDRSGGKAYIIDIKSGRKVLTELDWIARPADGDSLIVFAKDGKRGFFNRRSGEVAIPARYDAAWCFNDGVAGVCEGDSVYFINHSGHPANSRKFARQPCRDYAYHGNCFAFDENGKYGLVSRNGDIAVPAVYDEILPMPGNMWKTKSGNLHGVMDNDGKTILTCSYREICVEAESGIVATFADHSKKRFDYDGTLTDGFVCDSICTLDYPSDEIGKDGNRVLKAANLLLYSSDSHHGLIDRNGKPVTPPVYTSICAYSADLYACQAGMGGKILLDGKGKKVND
ncbi:MAG: WG repeat-containing protein [Bacteroidales bacterium]|nr:WG repeat-containing protein [Bacteroidales bacterium]MCM1146636.1 WG repeat-containing protein [Bacteroidales bacterium]MCM1206028.1 WG repeat-containing protein [Bacillota bacterium]MCM1511071.1 WG repeat-containing protein [Clostridium sp.]